MLTASAQYGHTTSASTSAAPSPSGNSSSRSSTADLFHLVVSPAPCRAVRREPTRVNAARHDLREGLAALHRLRQRVGEGAAPVSQLSVVVQAPTERRAVGAQRARVEIAGGDAVPSAGRLDSDGDRAGREGATPELSFVVPSPTVQHTSGGDAAAERHSGR